MKDKNALRWFFASISLFIFILPVFLADELSLLANWLVIFSCTFFIIMCAAARDIKPKPLNNSEQNNKSNNSEQHP
jgi:hypothetical protein